MKLFLSLSILLISLFISSPQVYAQDGYMEIPQQEFYKAQVISVEEEGIKDFAGVSNEFQKLKVKILEGKQKDKVISIENGGQMTITKQQKVKLGDQIVLAKVLSNNPNEYYIIDHYRLNYLPFIIIPFLVLIFLVTGKKGIGALIGLGFSLAIIFFWIVPQIIKGQDPLFIIIMGSSVILLLSTYLAHGISRQTTLALISTLIALVVTTIIAIIVVHLTKLAGIGNEEAYSLLIGSGTQKIDLQGLLLGGIIIGTLGALNDVTVTQAATLFELAKEKQLKKFSELFKRGSNIGKEHILSLVNTLILAYTGSSLALIILFVLNPTKQPYWVIFNSEVIYDEIAIAVTGSIGLILAVPLTTLICTYYLVRKK